MNKLWLGIWVLAISLAQTELSPEVFEIARELRCPICAGESAAESDTGLAREMRRTIAEQLAQGKSEALDRTAGFCPAYRRLGLCLFAPRR